MKAAHLPPGDWFGDARLKLRHLGVLLAIDRHRHIGRAARELHISQPALSKTLQELERAAGIALFERRAAGSVPTPAGEALVRHAKEVFGVIDRAGRELRTLAAGRGAWLAIGCSQSCSAQVLPRALSQFKRRHPEVAIQVSYESLEVLLRELRARRLDVVVARNPHGRDTDDLTEHLRFELPMVVICSTDHPLARARRVTWKSLATLPWILPPRGTTLRDDAEELFKLQGIKPLEAGVESASLFANSLLLQELGALSIAPAELARRLEGEGRFAVLPVRVPPVFGPNCALTLREAGATPAVAAFLHSLTGAIA